jgi:hypothetical protein
MSKKAQPGTLAYILGIPGTVSSFSAAFFSEPIAVLLTRKVFAMSAPFIASAGICLGLGCVAWMFAPVRHKLRKRAIGGFFAAGAVCIIVGAIAGGIPKTSETKGEPAAAKIEASSNSNSDVMIATGSNQTQTINKNSVQGSNNTQVVATNSTVQIGNGNQSVTYVYEAPRGDTIQGTRFTYAALDKTFEYGWIIFTLRGGQSNPERTYTPDRRHEIKWNIDMASVRITPDPSRKMVEFDIPHTSVEFAGGGRILDFQIEANKYPREVGLAVNAGVSFKRADFSAQPSLYVAVLADDPIRSVYALGWALTDKGVFQISTR